MGRRPRGRNGVTRDKVAVILAADPDISVSALARRAGIGLSTAHLYRRDWWRDTGRWVSFNQIEGAASCSDAEFWGAVRRQHKWERVVAMSRR